jgi:DNA-binding beta-propeller fold protein YncE
MKENRLLKFKRSSLIIFVLCLLSGIADTSSAIECIDTKFLFDIKPGANQPSDVAVGPNGYIYIVDGVNNVIRVLDGEGRWKFAFGTWGTGKGQFKFPLGIDISDNGKVFIADSGNHRVQVFDLKGKFLYMFNVNTDTDEGPSDPVDVLASNIKNYLYVSDNDNHKIKVYNQDGTFDFEWGNFGEGPSEFRYPAMLAMNEYNEVFVIDVLNTRAQKFDPFGKFISDISAWGVFPGSLFRPKGVVVDKKNRVFISDSYMGVVQGFTDLGRFLGVICENGKKREFVTPVGLYIDKKDRMLVVQMRSNKVTVFKLIN